MLAKKKDAETLQDIVSLLQSIDAIYLQHEELLKEQRRLEDEAKTVSQNLDSLKKFGPDEPQPYSFLLFDNLKDQGDGKFQMRRF